MGRKLFWIASSCILAVAGLLPFQLRARSSGASPPSNEKIIHSFTGGTDGENPSSDLILDSEGNLYGTTLFGGEANCVYLGLTWPGCGTVFELKRTAVGWQEQILNRFNVNGNGGALPGAGLIFDSAGNLYGTTEGNPNDCGQGNVFKLAPNSQGVWTETVLYSFTCQSGGYNPQTDLVFDGKGDLFGTAGNAVFELVPQSNGSWNEVTIHEFNGAPDGAIPSSGVVLDSLGNVYGMTQSGGTGKCELNLKVLGCGIVYELTPGSGESWTETVIYNFTRGGGFGVGPSSGLILDHPGHLFITTVAGGDGLGTVVELTKSQKGWEQRVLYRFYGSPDGDMPFGKVEINAGVSFGVTRYGGTNGVGTVFGLEHSAVNRWKERVLHSFAGGSDGSGPAAGVVSDSHGHLYGTTLTGGGGTECGQNGCGTVYEVTP